MQTDQDIRVIAMQQSLQTQVAQYAGRLAIADAEIASLSARLNASGSRIAELEKKSSPTAKAK